MTYSFNQEVGESDLYFSTSTIVWVEETLFLLREEEEDKREMFGINMPFETVIDVGNTSCFVAFSSHDTGLLHFGRM